MADWNVYTLHRFLQFREKSVHCIRTQENGDFIGVIFTCGDAEIHDLRKDQSAMESTRKPVLRLRNVIDLCFISIPLTSILDAADTANTGNTDSNTPTSSKSGADKHSASNSEEQSDKYKNAVLIARQNNCDELIRLGLFIEYEIGGGWLEMPISVELDSNLYQLMERTNINANYLKPFEIPITSISGFILSGYGNVIAMCSAEFHSIYVWRVLINKSQHQSSLITPIAIAVGPKLGANTKTKLKLKSKHAQKNKHVVYCMVMTKHALFASDLKCIRISPAPAVLWNGSLELKVACKNNETCSSDDSDAPCKAGDSKCYQCYEDPYSGCCIQDPGPLQWADCSDCTTVTSLLGWIFYCAVSCFLIVCCFCCCAWWCQKKPLSDDELNQRLVQ